MRGTPIGERYLTMSCGETLLELRSEPLDAEVYFVRRGRFVKIGISRQVKKRLSAIRSLRDPDGKVGPVELLLTITGGKMSEAYWHHRFRGSNVDGSGEWFHADQDLLGFVALCQSPETLLERLEAFEAQRHARLALPLLLAAEILDPTQRSDE